MCLSYMNLVIPYEIDCHKLYMHVLAIMNEKLKECALSAHAPQLHGLGQTDECCMT